MLGVDGGEVGPVSGFLRYLHRIERSPNTVRAYAHDLKLFWDFLAGRGWRGMRWGWRIWVTSLHGCAAGGQRGAASGGQAGAVVEHDESGVDGGDGFL